MLTNNKEKNKLEKRCMGGRKSGLSLSQILWIREEGGME